MFISENILLRSINLDLKHAEPNFSKIFMINNILITTYLNLHWKIVKRYTFYQKMTDFKWARIWENGP